MLLGGVYLGGTREVFHIYVYILEAVWRGSRAVDGLVRSRCVRVDHEGGVRLQGVDVCVICGHLRSGTKEFGEFTQPMVSTI